MRKIQINRVTERHINTWSSGKGEEVVSSNPGPAVETILSSLLIWIKGMKAKIVEK